MKNKSQQKPKGKSPSIDEFLAYAEEQIRYHVRHNGKNLNEEQIEEVEQDARLRIFKAFSKLDSEKGWKAFIQRHCFGAVCDYYRRGRGFQDWKWALLSKKQGDGEMLHAREYGPQGEENQHIESILNYQAGDHSDNFELLKTDMAIDWELLSRLCRKSKSLHMFILKVVMDVSEYKIAAAFGIKRAIVLEKVERFTQKLDDPKYINDKFVNQVIFALGLSSHFGSPEEDNGFGWDFKPINLHKLPDPPPKAKKVTEKSKQLTLPGIGQEKRSANAS